MDNSLIPRAFGPTDAKREREANARLAERQSSARNMSTSSIPAGGTLGLGGDVDVEPGGNINLSSGGGINVAEGGEIRIAGTYARAGVTADTTPYSISSVFGTESYTETDGKTYSSPGIYLTNPIDASISSLRFRNGGASINYRNATNTVRNSAEVSGAGVNLTNSDDPAPNRGRFVDLTTSGITAATNVTGSKSHLALGSLEGNALPAGSKGALIGWTGNGRYTRYRTNDADGHWLESRNVYMSAEVLTSVGTTGDGKLTIQATNGVDIVGALTNNGAPIAGGGGSYPTDNITLTGTMKAADVQATAAVTAAQAAFSGSLSANALTVEATSLLKGNLTVQGKLYGLPQLSHWEKSGTTSAPDSTVWGPGVVTADPAVSTSTGLLTMVSQDTAQIRDTGFYAISFSMRFPSGVTATNARSAASIEPMSGPMWAKGAVIQTDDQGAASIPNVYLTAGQQFHFYIVQISGATRVMSYTMRVTKIGG